MPLMFRSRAVTSLSLFSIKSDFAENNQGNRFPENNQVKYAKILIC